jgi:hypothetical protein
LENGNLKIGRDPTILFGMAARGTITALIGFDSLERLGIETDTPVNFAESTNPFLGVPWTFIIFSHSDFLDWIILKPETALGI